MTNLQNPTNQPARGGLVLRTCSFAHWNLFRISDFGFCPPFLPNRRCPAEEDVGKTLHASTLQRFNASPFPSVALTGWPSFNAVFPARMTGSSPTRPSTTSTETPSLNPIFTGTFFAL